MANPLVAAEMDRRRGGEFMQRAAGKPAAEGGVDRGAEPDQTLLAGKPRRMARVDARQCLAEMVQRGLWRGRAHGQSFVCSCFVLRFPIPEADVKRAGAINFSHPLKALTIDLDYPKRRRVLEPTSDLCI